MSEQDLLAIMADRIVTGFQPLKVILFGSRARADARPDSDADLLVVMASAPDKRALAVEMRRSVRDVPLAKDIIVTTPEELARRGELPGSVLRAALREGRVIFERN
jgi:predicted nucleotidyltransferase